MCERSPLTSRRNASYKAADLSGSDAGGPDVDARRHLDERVEAIAEQLVDVINEADPGSRAGLRDFALDLLRSGTDAADAAEGERRTPRPSTNPLGLAILLGVLAVPMMLIFLPLGLMMAAVAVVLGLTGVGMTVLRR